MISLLFFFSFFQTSYTHTCYIFFVFLKTKNLFYFCCIISSFLLHCIFLQYQKKHKSFFYDTFVVKCSYGRVYIYMFFFFKNTCFLDYFIIINISIITYCNMRKHLVLLIQQIKRTNIHTIEKLTRSNTPIFYKTRV